MSRPRVFVIQEPLKRGDNGRIEPKFTLAPLERYGEIVMLLAWSDTRPPMNPRTMMKKIAQEIEACGGIHDGDVLVPTGHPAAIAMATLIAYNMAPGAIDLLVWDGQFRKYDRITLNLDYANA